MLRRKHIAVCNDFGWEVRESQNGLVNLKRCCPDGEIISLYLGRKDFIAAINYMTSESKKVCA